ncbi:MAG: helix-turn-helix transcriptional regulator [Bacteroidales bacterium]|nr:helix-turn-helix transcriptional regulator [Bacteroidales bacterium]
MDQPVEIKENKQAAQPHIEYYIEAAHSFAAMSYQGVYLLDLVDNRYLYMSDYPLMRCGMTDEEVLSNGLDSLAAHIPQEELALLNDIAGTVRSAYANMPPQIRARMMLYLNFHVVGDRRPIMVCHKMKLIHFDPSGNPRLLLGLVAPSPYDGAASIMAGIPGTDHRYSCSAEDHSWHLIRPERLSPDELTMLRLSIQGHSIESIADLMCKSVDTIKYYRRQVFQKLNVKNIPEAIAYVTHYCLI